MGITAQSAGVGLAHHRDSGSLGWKRVPQLSLIRPCTLLHSAPPAVGPPGPWLGAGDPPHPLGVGNCICMLSLETTATIHGTPGPTGHRAGQFAPALLYHGYRSGSRAAGGQVFSPFIRWGQWGSESNGQSADGSLRTPTVASLPQCRLSVHPQGRGWADSSLSPQHPAGARHSEGGSEMVCGTGEGASWPIRPWHRSWGCLLPNPKKY